MNQLVKLKIGDKVQRIGISSGIEFGTVENGGINGTGKNLIVTFYSPQKTSTVDVTKPGSAEKLNIKKIT